MSTPTKEVVLPDSGIKAAFRTRISYGENRALQQIILSKAEISLDAAKVANGDSIFDKIPAGVMAEYNFKRVMILLDSLTGEDGKPIQATEDFINSLSLADGEFLEKTVNEIFEEKKKE